MVAATNKGLLHIGTSGWYYNDWAGRFYPPDLPKRDWLSYYVERFSTVEINATFYRLPFENMVRGWRARAPEGFFFAVKGSRWITHVQKLTGVKEALSRFVERVSLLEDRLGPVLWQLPPSLHKDMSRLEAFLNLLPEGMRHAVEFRHASWIDRDVFELLQARRVAVVAVSSPRFPPDFTVTGDFAYVRLHGLAGGYAHDYTREELQPLADHIFRCLRRGMEVFVYFNNDKGARAVKNALELKAMLSEYED